MMRRREFLGVVGGGATWSLVARTQESAMPVIGFLNPTSPNTFADRLRAFQLGLKEGGYVEVKTSQSPTAGPKVKMTGCQHWRPIWFVGGSP